MKVIDNPDNVKSEKDTQDEVSFLSTNRMGSYIMMSHLPKSRFEGVFLRKNHEMFKVIDSFAMAKPVTQITSNLWSVERERDDIKETFFMPMNYNALLYELNKEAEFDLILDCRRSYDSRVWGRHYDVLKQDGCLLIKFSKKKDAREDNVDYGHEFDIYTAVYSKNIEFKPLLEWEEHFYESDKERNSPPWQRHVFKACRIRCRDAVFAFDFDKKRVIKEAKEVYKNRKKLKNEKKKHVEDVIHTREVKDNLVDVAYKCALNAMDNFIIKDRELCAGLPWFFQPWSRDELISAKALMHNGYFSILKKILFKYINLINEEGLLPNRSPPTELASIDAVGWLFKRVSDFIYAISNMGMTRKFISAKEEKQIIAALKATIERLIASRADNWLFYSKAQETWMDTDHKGDHREGFRLEVQSLILFMFKLYRVLTDEEHDFETEFRKKVIESFWDGNILYDGVKDKTIRPNIFIAAYIYPELLSREEWSRCIDNALSRLWLDWGGLSSIDKFSKLFTKYHTGQDVKSYHRGDSWFWINNLAAIVMHRVDAIKFKKYINAIIRASAEEMLYKGVTGFQSELSSAAELRSEGCLAQTWSNAMFIELIDEIYP